MHDGDDHLRILAHHKKPCEIIFLAVVAALLILCPARGACRKANGRGWTNHTVRSLLGTSVSASSKSSGAESRQAQVSFAVRLENATVICHAIKRQYFTYVRIMWRMYGESAHLLSLVVCGLHLLVALVP